MSGEGHLSRSGFLKNGVSTPELEMIIPPLAFLMGSGLILIVDPSIEWALHLRAGHDRQALAIPFPTRVVISYAA